MKQSDGMKVYLIRHGESDSDIEDRYGGELDDHLTEKGEAEARQLAEKLRNSGIQRLYSSPKLRAKETAQIVQEKLGCELEIVQDFRERNRYASLTGMKKSEAREKRPDLVKLLESQLTTIPGAEPYESFKQRVTKALEKATQSKHETIGIVTHGGPLTLIFREVLKLGETHWEDCAYAVVEKSGNKFSVVKLDGVRYQ